MRDGYTRRNNLPPQHQRGLEALFTLFSRVYRDSSPLDIFASLYQPFCAGF